MKFDYTTMWLHDEHGWHIYHLFGDRWIPAGEPFI